MTTRMRTRSGKLTTVTDILFLYSVVSPFWEKYSYQSLIWESDNIAVKERKLFNRKSWAQLNSIYVSRYNGC